MRDTERIDGWKAIGAHFRRDRTTAIRWAAQRGMPVHSVPGGKTRTVYAFRSELDAWARPAGVSADAVDGAAAAGAGGAAKIRAAIERWWRQALLIAAGTICVLIAAERLARPPAVDAVAVPRDPVAAALFVQAREDWATRTSDSLMRSIGGFEAVTRRDPGFAPAFADLADAYLLGAEAGSLAPQVAYDRAEQAARRALQLDAHLAAANRALGFIAYWWNHDHVAAGEAFRQALRLEPGDAQTHFWYANILADDGQQAAAEREFDRAKLIDPGSVPIDTDYAWALWQNGRERDARARLERIVAAHPDDEDARDSLATVDLAAGDVAGFVREIGAKAGLRRQPELTAYSRALDAAFATGGAPAARAAALRHELAVQNRLPFPDRAAAAFYASEAGDRAALLAILALAERGREQWGDAGYVRRIALRWKTDRPVTAALARMAAPPVEPTDPT